MSEEQEQKQVQGGVDAAQAPDVGDHAAAESTPKSAAYPFSVLEVLGTALRVSKRNLAPFLVLSAVLQLPTLLFLLQADPGTTLLAVVLQMVASSLTSAVLSYGVIMELHGSRPSTKACIETGFAQVGRVLGVTVVSSLMICGAALLLLVPGVIVALMLYVVVPVTVFERLGVGDAIKRSRELTSGRKGDLFLLFLAIAALSTASELFAHYELGGTAALAWRWVAGIVTTMYFSVIAGVTYVTLRRMREGTQIPELATAFARTRK